MKSAPFPRYKLRKIYFPAGKQQRGGRWLGCGLPFVYILHPVTGVVTVNLTLYRAERRFGCLLCAAARVAYLFFHQHLSLVQASNAFATVSLSLEDCSNFIHSIILHAISSRDHKPMENAIKGIGGFVVC